MKHARYTVFFMVLMIVNGMMTGQAAALDRFRVGIVTDGPAPRFDGSLELFKQEILNVTRGEFEVRFPAQFTIDGGADVKKINQALDRLLSEKSVDLVLALGVISGNEACRRRRLNKPVIAPLVIDATVQRLPLRNGTSGVPNLNYIDQFRSLERSVRTLREVTPFSRAALIVDRFVIQSIPALKGLIKRVEHSFTMDFQLVPAGESAKEILDAVTGDQQAVIVGFLPRLPEDEFTILVDGINGRKLPSYAYHGKDDVAKGLLSSTIAEGSMDQLARNTAINVLEIFNGAAAENLPVSFSLAERLTINMATARAIGIYPGWRVLAEADLINDAPFGTGRRLNFKNAVIEAIEANLDYQVVQRDVAAGEARVKENRASLLPQVEIGTQATVIDEDRAESSFGLQPERLWTGTAGLSQQIYSERSWSDYRVEQHLQRSREAARETARLDVIRIAATAYLNVLRAKTLERVQKENLKLTRENLERARIRVSIGAAGPEEEYRWENQIADNRRLVLKAESATLDAMTSLNRILNRPLSETPVMAEADSAAPMGIIENKRFFRYMDNPHAIRIFGDYLVKESLTSAPELEQISTSISAKKRILISAKRAIWLPTFNLRGNVTQKFADGGEGTGPPDLPLDLDEKDDTDWTAGLFLDLPLFTGGRKTARIQRTREELSQLRIQYRSTAERIGKRVLNAVHMLRASYPGIALSRDAADAARRNLSVVTESYTRGIKSIIDLLDAQNQALVADQGAVDATYDFLVDLTAMQRSIGTFVFLMDKPQQDEWFQRVDNYFIETGMNPGQGV